MTEAEADIAFDTYQWLSEYLIQQVKDNIQHLNEEQQQYVLDRLRDEFRFWRC